MTDTNKIKTHTIGNIAMNVYNWRNNLITKGELLEKIEKALRINSLYMKI